MPILKKVKSIIKATSPQKPADKPKLEQETAEKEETTPELAGSSNSAPSEDSRPKSKKSRRSRKSRKSKKSKSKKWKIELWSGICYLMDAIYESPFEEL